MSIVYVLGAGASHGEALAPINGALPSSTSPPPMTTGFFSKKLLTDTGYSANLIEKDFKNLVNWIRWLHLGDREAAIGEREWESLNIEDVFTWLEIRREFESSESHSAAMLLLMKTELLSYIFRVIGLCTKNSRGSHSTALVNALRPEDSIITFNWDLLIDDCFLSQLHPTGTPQHYANFRRRIGEIGEHNVTALGPVGSGLFLKLHGSLNWFQCTNPRCSASKRLIIRNDIDHCLNWSMGINKFFMCQRCGSETLPMIVPPVLRKPIIEHETTRAAWGLARKIVASADVLVIIGFSAAPSDYYASWLLREAAANPSGGMRKAMELPPLHVVVVNPLNDPKLQGHAEFKQRMQKLFPLGYRDECKTFAEIKNAFELALELEKAK